MSPGPLDALRGPAGRAAFEALDAPDDTDPLAASTRLRAAGHDPAVVAAALTQHRLRRRAAAKLGPDAAVMFFTPDGVEQATRGHVAARRAARLAAAGATRVLDLGCGVGADLVALARAGLTVVGIERDPATAAVAAANVEALGLSDRAEVRCADATAADLAGFDAAFCDPARRRGGRRVFDPDGFAPPWSFLLDVAAAVPRTVLKVAPGLGHDRIPAGAEAEWVSDRGDVVEAALWCGPLARAPRRATVLPAGAELTGDGGRTAPFGPVRRHLFDPDGAVVRAHLVAELADDLGATLVDPAIAYLTADAPAATPFARAYEVTDVLPFSVKRLRAVLRARAVGTVEIKKRGSAVTPEELRPRLRLAGDASATVVLTRVAGAPTVLLCRPAGLTGRGGPSPAAR